MSRYLVVTQVDTNDADYVTGIEEVSLAKVHELRKATGKILARRTGNFEWPRAEYMDKSVEDTYFGILDADEIELIDSVLPSPDGGFHTIESIRVYTIEEETRIL